MRTATCLRPAVSPRKRAGSVDAMDGDDGFLKQAANGGADIAEDDVFGWALGDDEQNGEQPHVEETGGGDS